MSTLMLANFMLMLILIVRNFTRFHEYLTVLMLKLNDFQTESDESDQTHTSSAEIIVRIAGCVRHGPLGGVRAAIVVVVDEALAFGGTLC